MIAPNYCRRFVWNFYRLENEHLNNCGQFRAVRDISVGPITANDLATMERYMDEDEGVTNRRHSDKLNDTFIKRFVKDLL